MGIHRLPRPGNSFLGCLRVPCLLREACVAAPSVTWARWVELVAGRPRGGSRGSSAGGAEGSQPWSLGLGRRRCSMCSRAAAPQVQHEQMMRLPLWISFLCGSALLVPPSSAAGAESQNLRKKIAFNVIGGEDPVIGIVGGDAHLLCCLSPQISTTHMEIMWYRFSNDGPLVHWYHNGEDNNSRQDVSYVRRTALSTDHIHGCVQLQIRDVRPSDDGNYTCYFESNTANHLARNNTTLKVAAAGSDPIIHTEENQGGGITVVSVTSGWYPEPEVQWQRGDEESLASVNISKEESGLYIVAAQVHIRQHFKGRVTNTRLNTTKNIYLPANSTRGGLEYHAWKEIAIALFIVWLLTAIFAIWMGRRSDLRGCAGDHHRLPEQEQLQTAKLLLDQGQEEPEIQNLRNKNEQLSAELEPEIQNLRNKIEQLSAELGRISSLSSPAPYSEADVRLNGQTACPLLNLSADRKRVKLGPADHAPSAPSSGLAFQPPCAMGCQGFRRGKHCWALEVGEAHSWAVGVAVKSVSREGPNILNSEEGIWALGLSGGHYQAFTTPVTELSPYPHPKKLIVYLDLEAGQLSFYNAATQLPIYSFMCTFTEEVFPFVWTMDQENWITLCPLGAITSGQPQQGTRSNSF